MPHNAAANEVNIASGSKKSLDSEGRRQTMQSATCIPNRSHETHSGAVQRTLYELVSMVCVLHVALTEDKREPAPQTLQRRP